MRNKIAWGKQSTHNLIHLIIKKTNIGNHRKYTVILKEIQNYKWKKKCKKGRLSIDVGVR
jgi:hypothetical protein